MKSYEPYLMEYDRFMQSFRFMHAALYEKYHSFLEMDTGGSGRVVIKPGIELHDETRNTLTRIINEYYRPLDN